MFDIDFLPNWYRTLKRRKRLLKLEGWLAVMAIVGGGSVLAFQQRNIQLAQQNLTNLRGKLDDTTAQQKMLEEQISLRKQLQERKNTLAAVGESVESSRLLTTLESLMPHEMSLTEFNCSLEEKPVASSVVKLGDTADHRANRRLKVRVVGVAPSDMDLANFLSAMANVALFQDVIPDYTSPKTDSGHVLREFEIGFWIDLNPSTLGEVTWAN